MAQISVQPERAAGASCAQAVHLLLPPSCSSLLEQTRHGQDGKTGSLARGKYWRQRYRFFSVMKLLQESTLTGFLNALTPGALLFHRNLFPILRNVVF